VDLFLLETGASDVWRELYKDKPGFTYRKDINSLSRLDYFLLSPKLSALRNCSITIGNWELKKDHCRISLDLTLPEHSSSNLSHSPWSIPQPELRHLSDEQRQLCREQVNANLFAVYEKFLSGGMDQKNILEDANSLSIATAETLIHTVGAIAGMKKGTHKKGPFESLEFSKAKAEISTIQKARDLVRSLFWKEFKNEQERKDIESYLQVCLDRLIRLGNNTIPISLDPTSMWTWSESTALSEIEAITTYLKSRKLDLQSQEKIARRNMFLDPKKRGKWLEHIFGNAASSCPNFAIDSATGLSTSKPEEVKRIYLKEGSDFLKKGIDCPPPFHIDDHRLPEPPPDYTKPRKVKMRTPPRCLPHWWNKMYNRQAKGIPNQT